jgi:hypothetical protein
VKSVGAYPAPALLARWDERPRMFPDSPSRSELLGHSSSYGGAIWSAAAGSTSAIGLVRGEAAGVQARGAAIGR